MLLSFRAWLAIANGESESRAVGRESPPYIVKESCEIKKGSSEQVLLGSHVYAAMDRGLS